jgi:hypothetical protein
MTTELRRTHLLLGTWVNKAVSVAAGACGAPPSRRTFREPENLGCEKVGPGVHGRVPMPGHDDDTRVGQRPVHGLSGLPKDSRAVASAQHQRRHPRSANRSGSNL